MDRHNAVHSDHAAWAAAEFLTGTLEHTRKFYRDIAAGWVEKARRAGGLAGFGPGLRGIPDERECHCGCRLIGAKGILVGRGELTIIGPNATSRMATQAISVRTVVFPRPWLGTKNHAYQRRQPWSTDKTDQSMMIALQQTIVPDVILV